MGGGLEEAGAVGDGVEEARRRHPARFPRIFGHHPRQRLAFLRGGAGQRIVEHPGVRSRQVLAGQQVVDVRKGPAVDGCAGDVMGGETGGGRPDRRQEPGERAPVAFGGDLRRAAGIEAGEADRAAHVVGHAAALAVVVERGGAVVVVLADLDVGVVARLRRALVGGAGAGLGDQGARDGGAPEPLAWPGHDGPALGERLLGKGLPDGVGEVAAEMGEADDGVLGAVHAARQRRHEGDGGDDAHDRPGAEAEAPLARGVHDAGGGVPDQEETGEHQHARVEGEEHVAHGGRPVPAEPAEEGEHVTRRPVGVGEEPTVDGLAECGLRRRHGSESESGEHKDQEQHDHGPCSDRRPILAHPPLPRPSHPLRQAHRVPERIRERAAELGSEEEADGTHGLSWLRRPGWRGREDGASLPSPARGRRRRWRRAARRCGSAASRASARPPAA